MADRKASTKTRKGIFHPPAAEDNFVAALKWPAPYRHLGTQRAVPHVALPDYIEEPVPYMDAGSLPMWSAGLDTRERDSSVSSGRLSGSSGGHESCALPHGPWKERPPQVLGPQRQPRRKDPRLEQLRNRIRAQAQWNTSCASLGTSLPSSVSCHCKAPSTMLRRKISKMTKALSSPEHPGIPNTAECRGESRVTPSLGRELSRNSQHQISGPRASTKRIKSASYKREKTPRSPTPGRAAKCKDSELADVYAWRKGQALVRRLLGPPPTLPRLQSKAPRVELGVSKKAAASEGSPVDTWLPRSSCTCNDRRLSEHTPILASHDQPTTIQTAMAILQDLRKQVQAGLELARRPSVGRKFIPEKPKPQTLAGKTQQDPQSTRDMQSSLRKSDRVRTEGKHPSLDKAEGLYTHQPWSTLAEWESCPQRSWAAQEQDTSFQRSGTPPERLSSSQRPWSALAEQTYPHRAWATQGREVSFQNSESPPEKLSSSQRPWSALARQACPQRAWEVYEDLKVPGPRPRSSLERPRPALQGPFSSSFLRKSYPYCKGNSAEPPPSRPKHAWVKPDPLGKEHTWQSPPCPRLRGPLSQPHNSESLRDFMRQKAQARRRQALEQKALAAHTQELRNQRLQEVYRKQREAVLDKPFPVVSQRRPGIVTFVPCSAQSEGLEAPGDLKSPAQEWSKVTSGMVVGDQEAPDSFCLCLNRTWGHADTLDNRGSPDGYKQARLQELETMADILKKRIDLLTAKLRKSVSPDAAGDLASEVLPLGSITMSSIPKFAASTYPRALVPNEDRMPQDWLDLQAKPLPTTFLDGGRQPWTPSWESQSLSLGDHLKSQPQGVTKDRPWELEKRRQRGAASLWALSDCKRSSLRVPATSDTTYDSLWLEEMPETRGAGLVTPWTTPSFGQQKPRRPCSGGLHEGHLDDFQLKSLSFLESLKLNQQKQEQALALLRQRAEQEVWATQMALDALLFKHQLQQRLGRRSAQARPEKAPKPEKPHIGGDSEPTTLSPSVVTTRSRLSPPPLGQDVTSPFQHPARSKARGSNKAIFADLGRTALAQLHPSDGPTHQGSAAQPGLGGASATSHSFTLAMLEQSLREEELRAQHQAALLRLRELALEEKARAELAWLEHQREFLGNTGHKVTRVALLESQQKALSKLEKEWREIRHLRKVHSTLHHSRLQLLQHHQAILEVQRSTACLRQELQSLSPRVKTDWEQDSEKSQQLKEAQCPKALHGFSNSPSLPSEQQKVTSPQTTLDADKHLQPPRATRGDNTPEAGSPLAESGRVHQEPEKQPRVPVLGLFHSSALDLYGQQLGPAFPVAPAPLGVSPPVLMQATKEEEGSPTAQLRPQEAKELTPGDPLTKPITASAGEKYLVPTDSPAWSLQGQHQQSPRGEGPYSQETRQVAEGITSQERGELGLDVARGPEGKPWKKQSWRSGQQRREACQQEDPDVPFTQLEATKQAVSPASEEEEMPPVLGTSHPQPTVPLDLEAESVPSSCSGSSEAPALSPASSVGLENSLSYSSLQEFQKATATLVQLSDSSPSLSSLEAEITPDVNPRWSGEFSAHNPCEKSGPPSSWGLRQGHPQLENVHRDVEQVTWQRMEGNKAGSLCDSSEEVAVAGGPEPGYSPLCIGWTLSLPDAPSPRLGSELSETSSRIWEEDNLLEPGPHVDPASGGSLPADGSSDLESNGEPCRAHPSSDPREDPKVSRTSSNMASVSNTGQTKQVSPAVACTVLASQNPSTSDLDMSLSSSDTSTSEVACFSKGDMPAQTLAGFQEGPQDANSSLSTKTKPLQALLETKATTSLQSPPKESPGAKIQEAGSEGDRGPLGMEAASLRCVSGFLMEILSPVDEDLSYGSGDLPSSTLRDTHLSPPPPTPQAKSDTESNLSSEDFPSPPEEAMFPGGSLGALGEDTSITAEDMSSLSEEALAEAPSPGPQESGLCLRAPGQGGNLDGKQGDSSSMVRSQAEYRQWPEPAIWPASLLSEGVGSAPERDWVADSGDCAKISGPGGAGPVDVVSTKLSRRILCDSLAALSAMVPGGST